jgi:hypothetical protein
MAVRPRRASAGQKRVISPEVDGIRCEPSAIEGAAHTDLGEINVFNGARAYLHRWDFFKTRPAPPATGRIKRWAQLSSTGNINKAGTAGSSESAMFLPFQAGFREVVEPGILPLVEYVALELDFVTYTSCAGHFYSVSSSGDERRLGILPRHRTEYDQVLGLCRRAVSLCNEPLLGGGIAMDIVEGSLSDRGFLCSVIDIYFTKASSISWQRYFAEADAATTLFIASLRQAVVETKIQGEEAGELAL